MATGWAGDGAVQDQIDRREDLERAEALFDRLDGEELEGVLSHELSHVAHRDVLVMTFAGFLGVAAGLVMRWGMFLGGGRRDGNSVPFLVIWLGSIVVYFVWAGVYVWAISGVLRIALALFCGALFSMLTQTIFKVSIETYESSAYRRVAKGFRNPRRVRDAPLRIAFLTLSVMVFFPIVFLYLNAHLLIALLSYLLIVLMTVVLYLLACDPLPPCAARIAERLRAFVPAWVAASESVGGK